MLNRLSTLSLVLPLLLASVACGDEEEETPAASNNSSANNSVNNTPTNNAPNNTPTNNAPNNTPTNNAPNNNPASEAAYTFESRFEPGVSSVAYDGQTMRHLLIVELNSYIGSLTRQIDDASFQPDEEGEVVAALDFYFRFDSAAYGSEELGITTEPGTLQTTWDDVSTGKDLVGKLAGNDAATDHKDWSAEFAGWSDESIAQHGGGVGSPEQLVIAFFETLEANALDRADGGERLGPGGEVLPIHVTTSGQDLQQLVQKFLTGAIAFSQGADDYLDDDIEGKGMLAPNTRDGDKPWTSLEHAWDEGFGYFGATPDFDLYTDDEVAAAGGREGWSSGYHDSDGDGAIDLLWEYNLGHATNAAKRDRGSKVPVDLSGDAFSAFVEGRRIITSAGETLTADEVSALRAQRDKAVGAWEKAISATALHYINDTLKDMAKIGTPDYNFLDHAKHWSELKGFALALQFNPRSPLSDEDFLTLHARIGDKPALEGDDLAAYKAGLLEARDLLAAAYGFDAANLGDENGQNGW